jgi:hypothetical protein
MKTLPRRASRQMRTNPQVGASHGCLGRAIIVRPALFRMRIAEPAVATEHRQSLRGWRSVSVPVWAL